MVSNIKSKVVQSIKNKKLNLFGLFLLIAFFILVVTKLSETYVETIPFSIEYKNLPENNVITIDTLPQVNVTVSTNGFKLLSYYFYNPTYSLDFKNNTSIKDNTYLWLAEKGTYDFKQQLGQSVKIVSVKPDTLLFPYGVLSVKTVPVVLSSKVNYAPGYDVLYDIVLEPDSVKVIGSEQEISKIDVIKTQTFNLNDVKSDLNHPVKLDLPESSERLKISEDNVIVKAQVEKFTEGTFEIPVTILNKPNTIEINYFPKYMKVYYYVSLKNYKLVKPHDFKIECDYNTVLKTKTSYFTPKLIINSDHIKSAKLKQNKVEYIIVK
ncbi:YbbR-like domain-containing protein [uncultured Psychroserpens sp.]|uniref:YbbR-like domain-containing protein n=1 Tax=uncultured Psychroserpens sp. TaxID=255436 RepID=UPI00260B1C4D|nr:YbbR-like domain-containing protein [uncultured Psychroserpens sp.]